MTQTTYLTTFDDVKQYLTRGIYNYVLISELLLAELLVGDEHLMNRFRTDIIEQFYFDRGNLRLHEGYLRGMMGEVQIQLRRGKETSQVSPKTDGLRLIHNLINMLKTIHGIYDHGARDGVEVLIQNNPQNAELYAELLEIFNFIEMFFYVYQLVVSVDDNFDISEEVNLENLDYVSTVMGYKKYGAVRPALRLLTHYYENIERLRVIGQKLICQINDHLKEITVFNRIMQGNPPPDYPVKWSENKALNILKMFKIYRKLTYWDDVLDMVAQNDGKLLKELILSIENLGSPNWKYAFDRLLRLLLFDMDSMVLTGVLFF